MRIIFLPGWYPSRVHTTLGNFVQRHAEAVALRHEVVVVYAVADPRVDRVEETLCTRGGLTERIIHYPTGMLQGGARWRHWVNAARAEAEKADLVHAHVLPVIAPYLRAVRRATGKPTLITEHWSGFTDPTQHRLSWPKRLLMRQEAARAAFICPVSDHLGRAMRAQGIAGEYHTVYNVVDTDLFSPGPKAERPKEHFKLLHVSTLLDEQKNFSGLLRAFAAARQQVPGLQLEVISEGDTGQYQGLIHALGLPPDALHFHGSSPLGFVAERMRTTDALILFSNRENMPCVVLEAMASGLPVISTDVGGIAEVVGPGTGRLMAAKDEPALTHAILELQQAPLISDRRALHAQVRSMAGMAEVCAAYSGLYQRMVPPSGKTAAC